MIAVGISQITLVRDGQFMKQSFPRMVTDDGMVMDESEAQPSKQRLPKVTIDIDSGISMERSAAQPSKKRSPNLVKD